MDILRFYDYFDVKLAEDERDFPDNLLTELEFMAYLGEKESQAVEGGMEPGAYRKAQIDFLERHLSKWVHLLTERLQGTGSEPFYREVGSLMSRFIDGHLLYLKKALEEGGVR